MVSRYRLGLAIGLIALLVFPLSGSFASPTGNDVAHEFRSFYDQSGGLPVFGYALSEPGKENGRLVQYFERQRFELHYELAGTPYEVLLGHIGRQDAQRRGLLDHEAFQPRSRAAEEPGTDFFPETGHNLGGEFRAYWNAHGLNFGDSGVSFRESLALFGYPISEEFVDPETELVTQYFERARFEFHPEFEGTEHAVLLGLLGNAEMEFLRANGRGPDTNGPPGQRNQGSDDQQSSENDPEKEVEPTSEPVPDHGTEPTTTIQSMVDGAAAGGTVRVPAGIYRETVSINQPITLIAESGAEIRGSDVWSGWTRSDGGWVSRDAVPEFRSISQSRCEAGSDGRCASPEQVFVDGQLLDQVSSNPQPGQFAVNSDRTITLGTDPSGRLVEVTVREYWVRAPSGGGSANNVTIDGFTMKHASTTHQRGAIRNSEGDAWKVRNSNLSYSHAAAIWLIDSSNIEITNNEIHHNGQQAASLYLIKGGTVSGNTIHNNNTQQFDSLNEAGGIKGTVSSGLMFQDNDVYSNDGPGIWADMHSDGWIIRNNRIYHNSRSGITYEVSFNGRIHDNAVWENGHGAENPPTSAGINLQIAQGTEVYNNIVAWNGDGIIVWDRERTGAWAVSVTGNHVHDNDIFIVAHNDWDEYGLAWIAYKYPDSPLNGSDSGNRGENNRYFHANARDSRPHPFRWLESEFSWSELNAFAGTPGESNASQLTASDKDQTLSSRTMPTQPAQ